MIEDLETFAKVVFLVGAFLIFLGFTFMLICSGLKNFRNSKEDKKEKNNDKR